MTQCIIFWCRGPSNLDLPSSRLSRPPLNINQPGALRPLRANVSSTLFLQSHSTPYHRTPLQAGTQYTLTLFRPNIAVDRTGHVMILKTVDWDALTGVAQEITRLPKSMNDSYHTWSLKDEYSCAPSHSIYVSSPNGTHVVDMHGRVKEGSELSYPIRNFTHLPDSLRSFYTHSSEVWPDSIPYQYGPIKNEAVLAQISRVIELEVRGAKYLLDELD
ncbi:hypothetical protein AG1IA_09891 [Rhizoctonia solani AG-1 IA]|uniref:Uncharacterized protein n=1 Tax=Thanatephorus cucumeris (strain AG1-IA) TaxID=983506 RepID=L8WI87_THACA|nr:hypothetical protein AG1IA_09891 [Rhizoctonia solani AG-1 IA]